MEMINGHIFKDMLASGANNLSNKFTEIDALNVFPVPDGDTGTNMSLTFNAGVKDALACSSEDVCCESVVKGAFDGSSWKLWCYHITDF